MGNLIPEKTFDAQMHIIRDVHFDVDKYKIDELYVIKHKITNAHTIDGKMVGKLIKANAHALTFDIFTEVIPEGTLPIDPHNYYGITTITLLLDDIIEKKIEIERLMTETEAVVYVTSPIAKEYAKDIIPEPINRASVADTYKGDLSCFVPLKLRAAYKINTPEEAAEIAKDSQMNIVNDILRAAEEEIKNYVVWLTSNYDGLSKPFPILDSEGNFDPEHFKGLTNGSGRVLVKLVKGNSIVQFNVHSKYIKVTSDAIIIMGNKNKSSISMTLMRDNFREMFDKIEFEQIL